MATVDRSDLIPLIEAAYAIIGRPLDVIEIGILRGESSAVFLASPLVRSYIGVDVWKAGYDHNDESSWADMAESRAEAFRVIGGSAKGSILQMTSREVAQWDNFTPDLLYIDACHKYESVVENIDEWRGRATILSGHDYEPAWPGVMQAVDEAFPDGVQVFGTNWMRVIL